MGYIIKKGSGAGGGDATAANQVTQINQLDTAVSQTSVFKDVSGASVFTSGNDSVFKTPSGNPIAFANCRVTTTTNVVTFSDNSVANLGGQISNWIAFNQNVTIISVNYADAGGIAPNPHSAIIIYDSSAY
jgi:hypothetical protein